MIKWRKSSRSEGSVNGSCVELAALVTAVGVRDSKNPQLGHFTLRRSQFGRLLRHVKSGELDGTWSGTV
ncbi:DUF397 domain-containing protein [Actinomadura atramentaria]|uniref:DUF397 domain-containing protein n=1 Tax=Actinomadura atramentaria TaxID=1990 RepID=UPI000377BBF8|nr:DUF397 domain-containing protein [Actinomadura atramentaria]